MNLDRAKELLEAEDDHNYHVIVGTEEKISLGHAIFIFECLGFYDWLPAHYIKYGPDG